MPSNSKSQEQMITATIAGHRLNKITIVRELEPFYRRAAGLAATGEGGTIDKFYKALQEANRSESEAILLRKTLLEIAYRSEFRLEELRQLGHDFEKLNHELEECLTVCSLSED